MVEKMDSVTIDHLRFHIPEHLNFPIVGGLKEIKQFRFPYDEIVFHNYYSHIVSRKTFSFKYPFRRVCLKRDCSILEKTGLVFCRPKAISEYDS